MGFVLGRKEEDRGVTDVRGTPVPYTDKDENPGDVWVSSYGHVCDWNGSLVATRLLNVRRVPKQKVLEEKTSTVSRSGAVTSTQPGLL